MTTNETMLQLTDGVDRSGKIAVDALPYVDDEVRLSRATTTTTFSLSLFSNNLHYFFSSYSTIYRV